MSYSDSTKGDQKLDIEDISTELSSEYPSNEVLSSDQALDSLLTISSSSDDLSELPNRHVGTSCFWSTTIFSINFVSSILVINLAKWIYVKHHFPNLTLTTINFFVTFFLLLLCLQAKVFTYVRLPIVNMLPVSVCFAGFIAFSNLSLQYNTVGTYQLIKLQVTPTVMLISWSYFSKHYPLPIILSFVPVLIGTLISTYYDLQFSMFGFYCALLSVVFTALHQILVEHYQKEYKCNSLQLLFYQAPLSGLFLLFVTPFFEPFHGLEKFLHYETISLILLCGFVAFFVNLSLFWVIGNLSPVTYNMIGHSKSLFIIFIGSFIFREPFNQRQAFGLTFTMFGVGIYLYFKYIKKVTI